jgi:hypothetical protein
MVRNKLYMPSNKEYEKANWKQDTRTRKSIMISTRGMRRTYGTTEEDPLALPVLSPISSYKLLMSTKKSSKGKNSSESVMKSVVGHSTSQKSYHRSPVRDHERHGFWSLLSQLVVHATRRDGKNFDRCKTLEQRNKSWLEAFPQIASCVCGRQRRRRSTHVGALFSCSYHKWSSPFYKQV